MKDLFLVALILGALGVALKAVDFLLWRHRGVDPDYGGMAKGAGLMGLLLLAVAALILLFLFLLMFPTA